MVAETGAEGFPRGENTVSRGLGDGKPPRVGKLNAGRLKCRVCVRE